MMFTGLSFCNISEFTNPQHVDSRAYNLHGTPCCEDKPMLQVCRPGIIVGLHGCIVLIHDEQLITEAETEGVTILNLLHL